MTTTPKGLDVRLLVIEPQGGSSFTSTGCSDVNDLGLVVGKTTIGGVLTHFEWSLQGGFRYPTHLPPAGERRINNWGDSIVPGTNGTVDLILADGTHIPIVDPLDSGSPVNNRDLNDQLVVIGHGVTGTTIHLFHWNLAQGSQTVNIHAANTFHRINAGNLAVGHRIEQATAERAFVVDLATGQWTDLSQLLPGNASSDALDVNDFGAVVGVGSDGTSIRAFVWHPSTGLTYLPGLKGGPLAYVRPKAIDNRGRVVGSALTGAGENRAFLWDPAHDMVDLNDVVDAGSFLLVEALDLSETGVVIGHGFHGTWGPTRGFILAPVLARRL